MAEGKLTVNRTCEEARLGLYPNKGSRSGCTAKPFLGEKDIISLRGQLVLQSP